jgi:hypothetical protein
MHISLNSSALRYTCSFRNFRVGFLDWWGERCRAPWASSPSKSGSATTFFGLGVAAVFVMVLAGGVSVFGPYLAGGMVAVGTGFIAAVSMGLTIGLGLLFLAGFPLWAGWKTRRFVKSMCLRGWEIDQGLRTRA